MAKPYTPTPCRRCGGEKRAPKFRREMPRYCAPCEVLARRDGFAKRFPWWCGACDSPHYCKVCDQIKRDRWRASMAHRKERSTSSYFRPVDAERWWQHRSHTLVRTAVKRGLLPDLKTGEFACADCGGVALEYDHRDYGRPFDVTPVCRSCNKQRGTAVWPNDDRFQFKRIEEKS